MCRQLPLKGLPRDVPQDLQHAAPYRVGTLDKYLRYRGRADLGVWPRSPTRSSC